MPTILNRGDGGNSHTIITARSNCDDGNSESVFNAWECFREKVS